MTEALEYLQPTHGQGRSFEAGMPSAFFATEQFAHLRTQFIDALFPYSDVVTASMS